MLLRFALVEVVMQVVEVLPGVGGVAHTRMEASLPL